MYISTHLNVEWGVEGLLVHCTATPYPPPTPHHPVVPGIRKAVKTKLAAHIYAVSGISDLLFSIVISLLLLVQLHTLYS